MAAAGGEQLLLLTLEPPAPASSEGLSGLWVTTVPVTSDDSWLTPVEMRLTAAESTLAIGLVIAWREQAAVAESAFVARIGRLTKAGVAAVARAWTGDWDEWRFGPPLSGLDDERLHVIEHSSQRLRRFLGGLSASAHNC